MAYSCTAYAGFLSCAQSQHGCEVQVINAFEMPRHEWDESHKRFVRCPKPASIHAEPPSKPRVVLGRLQMLEQCIQRVARFKAGSGSEPDFHVRLTTPSIFAEWL